MASGVYNKIDSFLEARSASKEERHRLTVFLLGSVSGLIGFPLHFAGVWGSPNHTLLSISVANWLGILIILALYLSKKVSLLHAFSWYGVVMQAFLTMKIIYISTAMPPNGTYLILFNSFISMIIIQLLVMGYMVAMPFWLTLASLATSIAAYVIRSGSIQMQFLLFFFFVEIITCVLGLLAWRALHDVEKENTNLREEENQILTTLHMSREELLAYIAMSLGDSQSDKDINDFFDHLGERAEHNIIRAVKTRETEIMMRNAELTKALPMLSPTEIDVCRLILQGKTIKEIATLLDKTANNVSAVRIHVRKKLGLTTEQDLREYLKKRVSR